VRAHVLVEVGHTGTVWMSSYFVAGFSPSRLKAFQVCFLEPVRFAEKLWLKILFTDSIGEKSTDSIKKNKLKSTDYKTSEQGLILQ
jgi:hypothetical protein